MDRHIQEHAAGNLHIINSGRFRITGCDFDDLGPADPAFCHCTLYRFKIMIKPPVKTNLVFHFRSFQRGCHLFDFFHIMIDGFFTEYMLACPDCLQGNGGVCIR